VNPKCLADSLAHFVSPRSLVDDFISPVELQERKNGLNGHINVWKKRHQRVNTSARCKTRSLKFKNMKALSEIAFLSL
jgi:hypothetical protein